MSEQPEEAFADLPFSPAAARNADAILEVIGATLAPGTVVMEVGAGTGQHGVHFCRALPGVIWKQTDVRDNLPHIYERYRRAALPNLMRPAELDVFAPKLPDFRADVVYTANTLHIIPFEGCARLFAVAAAVLKPQGLLYVYGPMRYDDRPFAPSNLRFDAMLRERDAAMGVRSFSAVRACAEDAGFVLDDDRDMPANNQLLRFRLA